MVRTAVLVSGGGVSLQALIDAHMFGELSNCELAAVISSNPEAYALKRAELANIPCHVIDRTLFPNESVFGSAVLDKLRDLDIELVVLAGFSFAIPVAAFKYFGGRIIDSCPALEPVFAGSEADGERICAAVLESGGAAGAAAYFVTQEIGKGPVILNRTLEIFPEDTPSSLYRRVLEEGENYVLPRAVNLFCENKLKIENGAVQITEQGTGGAGDAASS